jgi:sucrose-6-phosphate hydrolase SacC (GH32 family)
MWTRWKRKSPEWGAPLLALTLLGAVAGCDGGSSGSSGSSGGAESDGDHGTPPCALPAPTVSSSSGLAEPEPSCFQGGETAILDNTGPIEDWTWNDPHVLKVGSQYWMYASSTDDFDFPVRLYRLVSDDAEDWTLDPEESILPDAEADTWDAGGWETPAVVYFKGRYHLFYTGYAHEILTEEHSVFEFRIGHATSCDGVHFTRVSEEPVVSPSSVLGTDDTEDDWYHHIVGEPGPVVVDGTLYLYFTAIGPYPDPAVAYQVIGLTTTTDGVTWSGPEPVLEPDPTLFPRVVDPGPPVDGWVGYSTPNAIRLNGETHLFYDVAYDPDEASWLQVRLHHSRSEDGISDWIQDDETIYSTSDFEWASREVRSPHALLDGTTLRLFFAGHTLDAVYSIGQSTCDLSP